MSDRELLQRLGSGETIDELASGCGWDRAEFDRWWSEVVASRLPDYEATLGVEVEAGVGAQVAVAVVAGVAEEDLDEKYSTYELDFKTSHLFHMPALHDCFC
mgnify:CR=1 FL=1